MCGIVGAVAEREVGAILLEGLRRLEYRGYDSAGMAIVGRNGVLRCERALGKVKALEDRLATHPLSGTTGIAHTRWATHGEPATRNAHPHLSRARVALVHNGIIENHVALRQELEADRYEFTSETDTEVLAHLVHRDLEAGLALPEAVRQTLGRVRGAYAVAVIDQDDPGRLVVSRHGSPLVIGLGFGENFCASDVLALLPVTQRFIFLEEGDLADIWAGGVTIWDRTGQPVSRPARNTTLSPEVADKGIYRHYLIKEIHEQPRAVAETLEGRLGETDFLPERLGLRIVELIEQSRVVHIVACGTSYHAGLVARGWIEGIAGVPCAVEYASEFLYRQPVVSEGTLFLTISQSGETKDTLAALQRAASLGYIGTLAICNVAESSLARQADAVLLTHAGPEMSVASTKAFTTQLVALFLVVLALAQRRGVSQAVVNGHQEALRALSGQLDAVLGLDEVVARLAERFVSKQHTLFLGRGEFYPIALEGALKLKEVSYIHAEAYAAGELKHGPLALIDEQMPVVAVAPNDHLLEKLRSNLSEVKSRGGQLIVFQDASIATLTDASVVIPVPHVPGPLAPIVYVVPLQLLAYHVAVLKGTDVDHPRNLAKSVTVE
ncbi:MAG: glutamine--fructose-6-phosphate transaminase (isomerizing) [Pseudomonadota bacterium]